MTAIAFAQCPATTNSISFLGTDTTTQGAWKGAGNFNAPPASSSLTYGKDGDILPDTEGCDSGCNPFPSYASFGPLCINSATPGNTGSKPNSTHAYVNLVQGPASVMGAEPGNSTNTNYFQCNYSDNNPAIPWAPMVAWRPVVDTRQITRWYTCAGISSYYLELSFGNSTHNFEVYVVDDMNGGTLARTEQLQVLDGNTNAVLWDSGVFTNFSGGIYYKWAITGHVKIKVINWSGNGRDAVINGVFFDPPNAAPLPVSLSVSPNKSSVVAGFSEQLIASVTNTSNIAVTWSINPAVGSISAGGVYTAPANVTSIQNVVVTATSVADPTKSASATVTILPPDGRVSGSPLVTSMALGTLRNNYTGWVGFAFKVGATPINVTGLGRIAVAGNTQSHVVKLVDAATGLDVPSGSVSVLPGGATPGTFAYGSLGPQIALSAFKTYYVLSQEIAGGDQWYDNDTTLQTSADATGASPIWGNGSWNSGGAAGRTYVPVDVKYTTAAAPPPGPPPGPVTGTPLVTSMTLGTLRNDYSGWVGAVVNIGPTPIAVTGLGRIAVAGNAQNHTVKLVDASTGIDVPNGATTVTPSNATAGTMAYSALPATVTLNANHSYYLVTQETYGGDRWYDHNSTLQTAAVATVLSSLYGTGAPYTAVGTLGQSYGVVDLLYSLPTGGSAPVITQQPQNATITAGQTATFSVAASSTTALTYQWQSQPPGTSGFTNISGAISSTYTTPAAASSDNGTLLRCVVTNSIGSVTTNNATLNVQSSGVPTGTAFVTSAVLGTLRNDYSGWVGMSITVGGSPLTITALGRMFAPGNSATHTVKIINAASGADVAGAAAGLTMSGTAGQFVYTNLASSVVLNANSTYYVLSQEAAGGDQWYDHNTTATTSSAARLNGAVYGSASPYVSLGDSGRMYVPVDFKFTAGSPAPGPAAYVTSATVGTPRSNFSGWVGMAVTVGSSPITVSSLGRMVVAGNSANHTVKLVNAAGVDVAGGSATVVTAGAAAGSFVYTALATPVTLNANTAYYLVSQETDGGDSWYDWDTSLQTASAASLTGAVWAASNSYAMIAGSAGHSYVPVDFKFQ